MPKDVLIRSVEDDVLAWIEATKPPGISKTEYLRMTLAAEHSRAHNPQASLFTTGVEPARVFGKVPFRFIDLFAGIGGFRSALTAVGGSCVYSSEWDRFAATTYQVWYGDAVDTRDIRDVDFENEVPDHDVLTAGFPCQPFSLAGVSKKNSLGRAHGFDDEHQGNLFFSIMMAVDVKRPPVVFLENVKNLQSHDRGNTWAVIKSSLEQRGYHVFHQVVDAAGWVPQHRERIFIVGFDQDVFGPRDTIGFSFPVTPSDGPTLGSILEASPDKKYMLSDRLWAYLQEYAAKHKAKGNGFGYGIADRNGVTRTMSARYHKDGSEILIKQPRWRNPRRLTPAEAALLLGFDSRYSRLFGHGGSFPQVVSDTQAYRQFGNAVVPRVVEAIASRIVDVLGEAVGTTESGCLLKGRVRSAELETVG